MVKKANSGATLTFPSDRETVITRVFAAPRRLVFEAWTQPEHVRRWYGLRSLAMTVCDIDLRPGGVWRYVVQAPDESAHGFSGVYREIVPHERLVYTEGYEGMPGADYLVTTTFDERDGKTTLTSHLLYKSKEHRDGHLNSGMEPGMNETLTRLDEHLDVMPRQITLTRVLDAPRELVWTVWTDPKHIAQWWGPNGFTNTIHEMDVRPGGIWQFIMHGPDGTDYKNKIVFTQVVKPERLAYEHVSGPKFTATATFDALGDKTQLNMQMVFETVDERTIAAEKFGAVEGLKQTVGRLGEYLAKTSQTSSQPPELDDLEIVSARVFAAARERVFEAYSNPNHLVHWWGPKGFTNTFQEFDLRPDGAWRFVMHGPDGTDYPTAKDFVEVVEPERIVFQHLEASHRFLMTMTFATHPAGTALTWRMVFESPEEFAKVKPHIISANEQNFDRLEAYLKTLALKEKK